MSYPAPLAMALVCGWQCVNTVTKERVSPIGKTWEVDGGIFGEAYLQLGSQRLLSFLDWRHYGYAGALNPVGVILRELEEFPSRGVLFHRVCLVGDHFNITGDVA